MKIDFHAHILPGADHGASRVETSLRQLALMREAGVSAVVATPHFYPHRQTPESFLAKRERAVAALHEALPQDAPTVYIGAEVLVCPGIHEMEGLEKLTIEGTNVLLLEMPTTVWDRTILDTVEEIKDRGFYPVMAHIDRYPSEWVKKLLACGVSAQLNATAFSGLFGGRKYMPYVEKGTVVALGSDLHGSASEDYKPFHKMLKRLGTKAESIFARSEELLRDAVALNAEKIEILN